MRTLLLSLLLLLGACAAEVSPYFSVVREPVPGGTRLRLEPAPGVRINAQQKPALERPDSTVLRFDSPALTADSAYFTEPPELVVSGSTRGRLVASICPAGEFVCKAAVLTLR
jgi:hypothetical protein